MIRTGNRNFWIAQLMGWGLFAIVNFALQSTTFSSAGDDVSVAMKVALLNSMIAFTSGFVITTCYRYILKKSGLNLMRISTTIMYIVGSTLILTVCFLLVANVLLYFLYEQRFLSWIEILGNSFIFATLMLMWNSLYFMIHYLHNWKNSESEKWQLAAAMKEAQLGNLKAQINPHFMFNAINNIKALISKDPDRAKDMLMNFSDMFRYSLVHNDQSMVTVEDELEIVNKYLELLSIQFEDKLTYEISADPLLLSKKIPPMMIQLLVENAVKHGISELPDGGTVHVDVQDQGEILILQVRNTGSLEISSKIQKKLGVGLQNIRERLSLIYGGLTKLNLTEVGGLVIAEIRIPLIMEESSI